MAYGVLPLSVLCQNVLLQNYLSLKDLGDARFTLLKRVLMKCTAQQLMNLESWNPRLLLEDEEIWANLIQRQFSQNVQQSYTRNISKIKRFYKEQLDLLKFDYSHLQLDNYIKYEELGNTKKFKLPSRLLYMKYQQEYEEKEKAAIETLRQRRIEAQEMKERNKLVHIDAVIPLGKPLPIKRSLQPVHSKLFQKSKDEAKKRRELFRNPLSLMPPKAPSIIPLTRVVSPQQTIVIPAITPRRSSQTTPSTSSTPISRASSSPIQRNRSSTSSIFHQPRRHPMVKPKMGISSTSPSRSRSPTPSTSPPASLSDTIPRKLTPPNTDHPSSSSLLKSSVTNDRIEGGPTVKKIKLCDYMARSKAN